MCAKEVLDPDAVNNYAIEGRLVIGDDGKTLTQTTIPRLMNAYDEQAAKLTRLFCKNFEKFKDGTSPEVAAAGPQSGGNRPPGSPLAGRATTWSWCRPWTRSARARWRC